jgi:hypothetical protein
MLVVFPGSESSFTHSWNVTTAELVWISWT